MRNNCRISVIIPAFNEERSIGRVLADIPAWVDEVLVVDNASTDATAERARAGGARVVFQPEQGYGAACLAGMAALNAPDVVVFLDGDYSDFPEEMDRLVDPIVLEGYQLVIGSRTRGGAQKGALAPQARFGNWLACWLIRRFFGVHFTDLGPFRAIDYASLLRLDMADRDYGWTVEMQIKAALHGLRVLEVPVRYRKRIGKSKITGTVRGVVGAGSKILWTIFHAWWRHSRSEQSLPSGQQPSGSPEAATLPGPEGTKRG
ncbi:MAG: glycosyltransferase family 2 protein [Calditrichaeota bacterium]|nr:MAG: glycosyltransferase family 2 protein [Calditrichota bacterium]